MLFNFHVKSAPSRRVGETKTCLNYGQIHAWKLCLCISFCMRASKLGGLNQFRRRKGGVCAFCCKTGVTKVPFKRFCSVICGHLQ
jgi:hypothetical protein